MKPPGFWENPPSRPGWQARALAPLAAVFAFATAHRVARRPSFRARIPVICVGNLNIGGTGKTPTAIALATRLIGRGLAVHVVSRGYGGRLKGPVEVNPAIHLAADVGDEPLLIAAFTTTWVARDRHEGVRAAQAAGADVVILDDGHQNPSVKKDLSIVVVDAARGFGNGRVIPAGPLREPISVGLQRADFVLSIGAEREQETFSVGWGKHLRGARLVGRLATLPTGSDWAGMRVIAFAGIGHPEKFFATLRGLGAVIVRGEELDDHQLLGEPLLKRLEAEALVHDAQLVTTEKDAVRLPDAYKRKVMTLPVRLEIEDWAPIERALENLGLSPFSTRP